MVTTSGELASNNLIKMSDAFLENRISEIPQIAFAVSIYRHSFLNLFISLHFLK